MSRSQAAVGVDVAARLMNSENGRARIRLRGWQPVNSRLKVSATRH